MRWAFGDGTVVYLGGKVQGDSALAEAIRDDVAAIGAGYTVDVQVEVCPSAPRRLDIEDPQLVNEWLNAHAVRSDVPITSAPDVEPIKAHIFPTRQENGPRWPIY